MVKKYTFGTLLLLATSLASLQAQTWQWGVSGGTAGQVVNGEYYSSVENAKSICTDLQGNVYLLSVVSSSQPSSIGGVVKPSYEVSYPANENAIASYTCEGAFRWSKVIGGNGHDRMQRIGSDSQGNIYAVGQNTPGFENDFGPDTYVHFDTDTILPTAYQDVNLHKESLFIVKYSSEGELLWLRMPQPADVGYPDTSSQYASMDLEVDVQGNCYWLCALPVGVHAAGAYTVTDPTKLFHVLKYDSDGIFTGGFPLDIAATEAGSGYWKFKRNSVNGKYYIAGQLSYYPNGTNSGTVTAGGFPITNSRYLISFDQQGNYEWVRTNDGIANNGSFYFDFDFDADNNIYFTSVAMFTDFNYNAIETFNGQPFSMTLPLASFFPYLVKMDEGGNTIWQTSTTLCEGGSYMMGIDVTGNSVALTGAVGRIEWGNISFTAEANKKHPSLLRFNATTGAAIDINHLDVGYSISNSGTSITTDAKGNYYIGGAFQNSLTVNGSTLHNQGGQTDFFLAKFGNSDCDFLSLGQPRAVVPAPYPNPTDSMLHLNNATAGSFELYSMLGARIAGGGITPDAIISMQDLTPGIYLLKISDNNGNTITRKIIRK